MDSLRQTRRRLPTLAGLRAFESAARHRSFKRAAEELCVTESSISHQVRGLEQQLGVKLFERLHRRVALTTEGIEYMLVVSKAFSAIEQSSGALMKQTRSSTSRRRRLPIACEPGFARHWLLPRLEQFRAVAPDIDVEIVPTLEPLREMSDRCLLGIHYGLRISGAMHCEEIARTRLFPVCTPATAHRARQDLRQIQLYHDRSLRLWGEWLEAAKMPEVDWKSGTIVHGIALCMDAALHGHGIALGNEVVAGDYLNSGALVRPFPTIIDPPGYRWYIVVDTSTREADHLDRFRQWLMSQLDGVGAVLEAEKDTVSRSSARVAIVRG